MDVPIRLVPRSLVVRSTLVSLSFLTEPEGTVTTVLETLFTTT